MFVRYSGTGDTRSLRCLEPAKLFMITLLKVVCCINQHCGAGPFLFGSGNDYVTTGSGFVSDNLC